MGDRSMVPPRGGMMPRNRFRYGSVTLASGPTRAAGGLGNQVSTRRTMIAVLYRLLQCTHSNVQEAAPIQYISARKPGHGQQKIESQLTLPGQ